MRHDEHYVETLAASAGAPLGLIVPIDLLDPNPGQPRQVMGDLSELMASIAEKGIIEPLIVRQLGNRYQIIAGERRYHAAVQVGLREVPVIPREADDAEVMELALIENLQRKDLTAFEEAEALDQLAQKCRYTHEDMARKLGKSRTSVTESLSLNNMPKEVRNLCRLADISSKSTLLQIVRQSDPENALPSTLPSRTSPHGPLSTAHRPLRLHAGQRRAHFGCPARNGRCANGPSAIPRAELHGLAGSVCAMSEPHSALSHFSNGNENPRFGAWATHCGISGAASSTSRLPAARRSAAAIRPTSSDRFLSTSGTRSSSPHAMLITSLSRSSWFCMYRVISR